MVFRNHTVKTVKGRVREISIVITCMMDNHTFIKETEIFGLSNGKLFMGYGDIYLEN